MSMEIRLTFFFISLSFFCERSHSVLSRPLRYGLCVHSMASPLLREPLTLYCIKVICSVSLSSFTWSKINVWTSKDKPSNRWQPSMMTVLFKLLLLTYWSSELSFALPGNCILSHRMAVLLPVPQREKNPQSGLFRFFTFTGEEPVLSCCWRRRITLLMTKNSVQL